MTREYIGYTYTDTVTGFSGIAVAHATYLTGCDQVCLQPKVGDAGAMPESRWFDVTRLAQLPTERVQLQYTAATAGADPTVLRAPGMRA